MHGSNIHFRDFEGTNLQFCHCKKLKELEEVRQVGEFEEFGVERNWKEGGEFGNVDEPKVARAQQRSRKMKVIVGRGLKQLNKGSSEEDPVFEYKEEEKVDNPDNRCVENQTRIKWDFCNDTWQNPNFIYDPQPRPFFERSNIHLLYTSNLHQIF